MTGRERVNAIFNRQGVDRVGFWKGNPHEESVKIYCRYFGLPEDKDLLGLKLKDDFNWLQADSAWKHPEGKSMFDVLGGHERISLSQDGVFAGTTNVKEVEAFDWPDPDYLDFTEYEKAIDQTIENGMAVCGGMWSPFFHLAADFFGMENYFCKMYTDPIVVEAVTKHLVDFYLEANRRCFEKLADKIDVFFLGNDFGSQKNLLISPEMFEKFVLPGFKQLIDLAKSYDLKVMLHSCGAITKAIPYLIDAGVDALHPLQAKAVGMEAENLAQFKKDIIFVGGVDTQDLLPFGRPQQIKDEVRRLKDVFGDGFIASPSHEALLPDVPVENVIAMMEAATE
ncbi:uroporphyrinogen decarboxylase family protein [Vallitalea okinawensis]|uniref:uroporphyrinogen decarboxylase family protein n=1 Tax=Vallitalea okinawensis TaxID=2078660 RepID=UPI000CFB3C5C|nr:uroporphyrinogen decarboxylase family protein [Vallitalea okinawensis]